MALEELKGAVTIVAVTHREALKAIRGSIGGARRGRRRRPPAPAFSHPMSGARLPHSRRRLRQRAAVLPYLRAERREAPSREAEITVVAHCTDAER